MVPTPTRTYGPLHLEDLEPHRFEDLVRQLIYEFRAWRQLEATGRGGGDDGFDVRGYEIMPGVADAVQEADETDEEGAGEAPTPDRLWLVQCKREKAIGKTKLSRYLEGLSQSAGRIDALLFVAACDFSKDARDAFRDKARQLGLAEAHLWGKAELEDQLFQPKNDHLLFAYFGISLQSRQRSFKTAVRSKLVTKRKAKRLLPTFGVVLVRDAEDHRYPYLDSDINLPRWARGRWKCFKIEGCRHDGVHFVIHRHMARLAPDGEAWDFVDWVDDGPLDHYSDPWLSASTDETWRLRNQAMKVWDALPPSEKAWLETRLVLPYENIIDIDEGGDEFFHSPHVYVSVSPSNDSPFSGTISLLQTIDQWAPREGRLDPDKRVRSFPTKEEALAAIDQYSSDASATDRDDQACGPEQSA